MSSIMIVNQVFRAPYCPYYASSTPCIAALATRCSHPVGRKRNFRGVISNALRHTFPTS